MAKNIQTAADRNTIRSAMRQTTGMYKDQAALLAETDTLPEGEVFGCIEEGYSYEVAAAAATDHDETTAGGDKLYRLYPETIDFNQVAEASGVITGTPTGTAGNVNGSVQYSVSYITENGGVTQTSNRSAVVSATNETVDLTNIPVSPDRRVVARKIYRTPDGVSDVVLGQLLTTINDNTTTTYTDNTADGSLGALSPWKNTTGVALKNGADIVFGYSTHATAFGINAMPTLTGGYASTAVGADTLTALTSGVRNTAVGHSCLHGVTTGNVNTAVGIHAGEANTTGNGNISIGYNAHQLNVTGGDNVSVGNYAGGAATASNFNVHVGGNSGQTKTSGNNNVAVGYSSLRRGTGANNVSVGHETGYWMSSGNFNTFLGYHAGYDVQGGSNNTLIGQTAGQNINSGTGNICLGAYAGTYLTTESNALFIDNAARTDLADSKVKALVYGVMAAAPASQTLALNAVVTMDYGTILGVAAPASAADTGTAGEVRVDADYIYVCTATDTWKRVAIATW